MHLRTEDARYISFHTVYTHGPTVTAQLGREGPGAEPEADIRGKPVGAILGQDTYKNNF